MCLPQMLDFGCMKIGGQVKFPTWWGILLGPTSSDAASHEEMGVKGDEMNEWLRYFGIDEKEDEG